MATSLLLFNLSAKFVEITEGAAEEKMTGLILRH